MALSEIYTCPRLGRNLRVPCKLDRGICKITPVARFRSIAACRHQADLQSRRASVITKHAGDPLSACTAVLHCHVQTDSPACTISTQHRLQHHAGRFSTAKCRPAHQPHGADHLIQRARSNCRSPCYTAPLTLDSLQPQAPPAQQQQPQVCTWRSQASRRRSPAAAAAAADTPGVLSRDGCCASGSISCPAP